MIPSPGSTLIVAGRILITFSLFFSISFRLSLISSPSIVIFFFCFFIFGCFILRKGEAEEEEEEEEEEGVSCGDDVEHVDALDDGAEDDEDSPELILTRTIPF